MPQKLPVNDLKWFEDISKFKEVELELGVFNILKIYITFTVTYPFSLKK